MINNNIDDGDEGISYYSVDWTGCPSYLVKHHCQAFKIDKPAGIIVNRYINGYQPIDEVIRTTQAELEKFFNKCQWITGWIIFVPSVWFFSTKVSAFAILDIIAILLASTIVSIIGGIIGGGTVGIIINLVKSSLQERKDKIKAKNNEVERFITECRNLR
ncbi:putative membrane protein [Escherichia phage moha]|uniref:Putative membrane protein n=1 Tax=Escherichia phage moha TaxID=2696423 RepID=A0A6B9WW36_9CAUD|nr:putative membrane protein [Escherichia phage moha]